MPLNSFARNESRKPLLPQPQPSTSSYQNSITRRSSAPLLRALESKPARQRPKVDTNMTYQRPGMSPIHKSARPTGNLSTFGTPYTASWETSRESVPRPSTAPLPDDDDELVGGVHYTTYGSRTSQVYEAPFSDVSVPVPQELLAQAESEMARSEKEKEKGHRRSGSALLRMVGVEPDAEPKELNRPRKLTLNSIANSITHQASHHSFAQTVNSGTDSTRGTTSADDTTLISMSRFPLPPDSGTPKTPGVATPTIAATPTISVSSNSAGTPRPATPGSMITLHPNTPSTPAIPEFLAASRTIPEDTSARSTLDDSRPSSAGGTDNHDPKPRLRTRSSLLALAVSAAAMVGVDVDAPKPETPQPERAFDFSFPLPEHIKAAASEPEPEPEPRPRLSDPSNPRRRSILERLTSRITTPVPDTAATQDATWHSNVSSDWTDAEDTRQLRPGPVLDFDLAPEEPLVDMEQFRLLENTSWSSPVGQSASIMASSTPKAVFPTSRDPDPTDLVLSDEEADRARTRTLSSKLSMTGRKVLTLGARSTVSSRKSRRRVMSGDSIPTRARQGGRLESLTRRQSADVLSAEGTIEGTVLYGVGEEMLRLMFASSGGVTTATSSTEGSTDREEKEPIPRGPSPNHMDIDERTRERTRSLPRPRANLVSERDLTNVVMPLHIRPKGHRRGTASKENASLDLVRASLDQKPRPLSLNVRSSVEYKPRRSRSKSTPLGQGVRKSSSTAPVVGILTNGNNSSGRTTPTQTLGRGAGRIVIVNSATTPITTTRKTTRSNPMPLSDSETSQTLVIQPGVIVTAPTPPAPRRSLSMPIEALPIGEGSEVGPESPKGTVSRGTSVQFVPESFEGRRRGGRNRKELVPPVPEVNGNGNGKGKRKVEREPTEASDASVKKPRLSVEDMDITFMGEPLFDGRPQHRRGGFGSQASSHPSTYSRHSQSYSRHSQSYSRHSQSYSRNSQSYYAYPTPTSSPDPERTTIPMHAILTPRVQSLYGTAKPDYASHRQSISSIPRPKSRASARSTATGANKSQRSNKTGASQRGPKRWHDKLPIQGWCFLVGFLVPFVWWYAAFARAERGYYGGGIWSREVESQWEGVRTDVHRDDGRIDAHTWRFRCRLMAVVSIVVYVPVIVLAAVFA
ncbi:Mucin-2 [Rhizoctonia solani]|uniref:Mucin-2 n=1 Tax=Rhizoctonia solani TaxID=456999 RepID=A0A0K6FNP5_9AGAM|nr:Mucin-2 [Rhizoctonia solani]